MRACVCARETEAVHLQQTEAVNLEGRSRRGVGAGGWGAAEKLKKLHPKVKNLVSSHCQTTRRALAEGGLNSVGHECQEARGTMEARVRHQGVLADGGLHG